jgi:hypothetical protein
MAAVVLALCACPVAARASEVAVGVEAGTEPDLVRFDTAAPGTLTGRVPVAGLLAGETIAAIDLRPATGDLFAVTSSNRVLIVDPETGSTQPVGASLDVSLLTGGQPVGFDFNPTVDRLRLANAAEDNLRFNPITFVPIDSDGNSGNGVQGDTDLSFIGTDPHSGANPNVVAEGYTNNDTDGATPTTLFGIDSGFDVLVRQGAVDGNAGDVAGGASPNGGLLTTIGSLGVDVSDAALDVVRGPSIGGNVAYAAMRGASGGSTLYTIALGSGTATSLGAIDGAALGSLTIMVGGAFRAATPLTATSEAVSAASVAITRIGDTLAPAQVGYSSADGSAVAGRDYTDVSGTLDFAQDERTKTVTIPLTQDAEVEGTETMALGLGPVSRGAVLDARAHTIAIADDDQVADRVRPALLLAPTLPDSLRALGRAGRLRLKVACSEACTVRLTLKLGRARLGRASASLGSAGVKTATLRLSKSGRRAVKRSLRGRSRRAIGLTLTGTATDTTGNSRTSSVKLRLARR